MSYDTAVFWDMDNLTAREWSAGQNGPVGQASGLSLRRVLATVTQKAGLGRFAVNRAYADWSNQALLPLRRELNELGIEPAHLFGSWSGDPKAAAVMLLVADAVELLFLRPALKNFVIVTGDGDFSTLARKLRGYGKRVIGCARASATDRAFAPVFDTFVPFPEAGTAFALPPVSTAKADLADAFAGLWGELKPLTTTEPAEALDQIVNVLKWIEHDGGMRAVLSGEGLSFHRLEAVIARALPGLSLRSLRLGTASKVVLKACERTGLTLRHASPTELRLVFDEVKNSLDPRPPRPCEANGMNGQDGLFS
jgi:hypothetical protein